MERVLFKASEALPLFGDDWTLLRIYAAVREGAIPPGVVVKVGTRQAIRFHRERLKEWLTSRPPLISPREAAQLLGCHRNLIYLNSDPVNGIFPPEVVHRQDGRLLLNREALEKWLAGGGTLAV